MRALFYYFLLLTSLPLLTCSQKMTEENTGNPLENLQTALEDLEKDKVLSNGSLAFSLKSTQDPKTILELNAHKTLNVASCMKAITTATALDILGKDFTYKTYLEYDGNIQNGVLEGNIYIRGTGDPTLGTRFMKAQNLEVLLNTWTQKIRSKGIKKIAGQVIADESYFSGNPAPMGWIWGDMGNYFGASAQAINVKDNTYRLYFKTNGSIGEEASLWKTDPKVDIHFHNQVKIAQAGTGDNAYISSSPYSSVAFLEGTVPQGTHFSIRGAITDPALFLAKALEKKLKQNQINITDKATTSRLLIEQGDKINPQRITLATHTSPNVKKIVDFTNLYSVNLYAEALLKAMGKQEKNEDATTSATQLVQEYWKNRGVDIKAWYMQDGSGLSQSNGITANHLTDIFKVIAKERYFQDFYTSLPIAGVSGTMARLGKNSKAYNNLRAKTGGMTRVFALVGYFKNSQGKLMSFSLIANQYTCTYAEIKQKLSKILTLMCEI